MGREKVGGGRRERDGKEEEESRDRQAVISCHIVGLSIFLIEAVLKITLEESGECIHPMVNTETHYYVISHIS